MALRIETFELGTAPLEDKSFSSYTKAGGTTIRPHWIPEPHVKREADLQRECLKLLKEGGLPVLRVEGGAVMRQVAAGVAARYTSQMAGWPDCLVFLPPLGRVCGLEFKRPGGHITWQQLQKLADLRMVGGLGGVITSVDGLDRCLKAETPLQIITKRGLNVPVW